MRAGERGGDLSSASDGPKGPNPSNSILSVFQVGGGLSMTTRAFSRWMAVAVCAGAFAASVQAPVGAADGNKACGLLTPSELQTVLGTTVNLSGGGGMAA